VARGDLSAWMVVVTQLPLGDGERRLQVSGKVAVSQEMVGVSGGRAEERVGGGVVGMVWV
jgi:hypothetical protein